MHQPKLTTTMRLSAALLAIAAGGVWVPDSSATSAGGAGSRAVRTHAARMSPYAHAARTQRVTDYAHLRLVSSNGNTLVERGRASGTLPGTVEVSFTLRNRMASSSFTIHTSGGTISGHGQGKLKAGKGGYDSFGGWVAVTRGTGRFHGAHGKGGLYGAIYRITDAMTVQVTGTLYY